MATERILDKVATEEFGLGQASEEMLIKGWTLDETADPFAVNWAVAVAHQQLSIAGLRAMRRRARGLGREVMEICHDDMSGLSEVNCFEGWNRLILGKAVSSAYKRVNTPSRLTIFRIGLLRVERQLEAPSSYGDFNWEHVSMDLILRGGVAEGRIS